MEPIWDVTLQALFYGSLILVPYETVVAQGYGGIASVLIANPLAAVVQEARNLAIDPTAYASAADAIGGGAWLLVPLALVAATFLLGLWVFNREAPRIAEEL